MHAHNKEVMMNDWHTYSLDERIFEILRDVQSHEENHHFGRPFITSYQLEVLFTTRYPDVVQALGFPAPLTRVGGRSSLAQTLSRGLSQRIKNNPNYPIEGRWLSRIALQELVLTDESEHSLRSSVAETNVGLAMYRLRDEIA
jgi:hypothetical protein